MVQLRKTSPERMEHISFFPHWLWDKLRHNGVTRRLTRNAPGRSAGGLPENGNAAAEFIFADHETSSHV
jgi:hypothetical protein